MWAAADRVLQVLIREEKNPNYDYAKSRLEKK